MVDADSRPVRERIEQDSLLFDSAVVSHGFAPFLRDYDVVIEVPAAKPDGSSSYIMGRFRYRFTHCPEAHANSTVDTEIWRRSWDDLFTDYQAWEAAGAPAGYVWGVRYAAAYPGMSYVALSASARQWTEQLDREMHEVRIETNAWVLRLVFHDLRVEQLAAGDPTTGALTDLQ
jgi:hypothetical protein